jgi:hypothetical protein
MINHPEKEMESRHGIIAGDVNDDKGEDGDIDSAKQTPDAGKEKVE